MSFRPSLLQRWLSRPSEVLQRATQPSSYFHPSIQTSLARPSFTFRNGAKVTRRTFTTSRSQATRFTTRSRTGPSSFQPKQQRRYKSDSNSGSGSGSGAKGSGSGSTETGSLSQRLKKLSREYGWAALGVYLALSALDFPFCFAAVRLLGVERIGYYEHVVVGYVKDKLKTVWPQTQAPEAEDGQGQLAQAEERNQEEASKSFFFLVICLGLKS